MHVDWERFTVAYAQASEGTRNLIDSDTLPLIAEYLCVKFSLAPELKQALVVCLIHKVLDLNSDTELTTSLGTLGLPTETIQRILLAADEKLLENSAIHITDTSSVGSVSPIRTMPQAPAGSEPVYTSTQAAILHESTQEASAPTPSPARWDTERS